MRFRYVLPIVLAAAAGIPAHADISITPIFDSSISGDLTAVAAINTAIGFFEATYANPINVVIDFESMSSGLGESQVGFVYNANYKSFYNALVTTNANPAAIAGLTANGGNAANNPVNGTSNIRLNSANGRALGENTPALCNVVGSAGNLSCSTTQAGGAGAIDGIIGLNTSITFPPNPTPGNYSLIAVAEHEIDEILGLGSALPDCVRDPCTASNPAPEDLFRYTAPGVFATLSPSCSSPKQAYFSYSGAVNINNFNTACNGADWGDWAGSGTPHVQDAFGIPGVNVPYGVDETDAMSAIGYRLAPVPEPGAWALLLSSIGILWFAKRRRRA